MSEQWRPVVGFEKYEVSDQGRVRSVADQELIRTHVGNSSGHLRVVLRNPQGGWAQRYVHRLVLEAFEGAPEGRNALHWDDDATNNHLSNLRWGTQSENMWDKVRNGNHHLAKRELCPQGHPLDREYHRPDGTFHHRWCSTCRYGDVCPQGHPFDGLAYWPDGSVRLRFCKQCKADKASRQMKKRYEVPQTHCKSGHLIDGVRMRGGVEHRYCVTCNSASSRASAARKKALKGNT